MTPLLRANSFVRFAALYAVVIVVILVLLGLQLHRLGRSIREHAGFLERREEVTRRFETLLSALRETEDARHALFRIRPHPTRLIALVQGLEASAARAYIEQKLSASPGVIAAAATGYPSAIVRYHVGLLGPWEKVEAYLRELARLPQLVRVEELELETSPEGDLFRQGQARAVFVVAVLDAAAAVPAPQESLGSTPVEGLPAPSPTPVPPP